MRYFCAALFLLAATPLARADGPTLKEARQRLLRGNYAEARDQFAALAKDAGNRVAAAVGTSRAWRSEGEFDKALTVLDDALKDDAKSPELLAERADLLYARGRWDDAAKDAKAALLASRDQNYLAHWVLARIHRDRGDFVKVGTELIWFIRAYKDKDITDPEELLLVGLAAAERARWDSRLSDQFQFVLSEIWAPVFKADKDFWPAEYASGHLYQEKYNFARAHKAFDRVLAVNPRAAEALVGKGAAALQRYEVKDAEDYVDRALAINPRLTEALRLKADTYLMAGNFKAALAELDKARAVNPREEPTLARVAAVLKIQKKDDDFAAVVKTVERQNPKPGLFYAELGERFEERRNYSEAEKHYKTAIKLRPSLAAPRNHLGLLYMRLGKEDEARTVLDQAFDVDPFNVRVDNSLKVLKHLDGYQTLETEHFLLRHDPKNDKVLARFMAKYLEEVWAELADLFQYRPKGKILIEVFNRHDMFSGRVVALPDLHTIGACTGRLVAMVSATKDQAEIIVKPFNWVRVVRHELVHVFNLEQTDFKVPHWFTEGLAVSQERFPMPPSWLALLKERVSSGELMNLDNVNLGFIRPGSGDEWQLAYLQSFQYVEYLKETYGKQTIGGFLQAYADGLDTDAALQKVCKVGKAEFEKGYRRHLEKLAEKFAGRPPEKVLSFKELRAAHAKDPDNPDVAAQLAERYVGTGNLKEAQKLADAAMAKKARHPLASYVLARVLLEEKKASEAYDMLRTAVDERLPEPKVLRLLGRLQFEAKKFAEAAQTFELGHKAEPYESTWLVELAKCYNQGKNDAKLIDVLKDLAPTNADDLATRRKLAELLAKAGRHAEAERYAREALEIDVTDAEARRVLFAALEAQNKADDLRQMKKLLEE
jgi:tetratricopeptide (TPR) repeat protein